MIFLMTIGIFTVFYAVVTLTFHRDKYDLERRWYNFVFMPIILPFIIIDVGDSFGIGTIIEYIITLTIVVLVLLMLIKISGYNVWVKVNPELVQNVISKLEGFEEDSRLETHNKKVYIKDKQKVRVVGSYVKPTCSVYFDFKIFGKNTVAKEVISELTMLDGRKNATKEGALYLVVGIIVIAVALGKYIL